MKLSGFVTVLFLVSGIRLFAQIPYEVKESIEFFRLNQHAREESKSWLEATDIEGSPYWNDEFKEGTVFTKSKTQYSGISLRYNIYSDQVEFLQDEERVQVIAAPETIEKIEMNGHSLVYIPYLSGKKIKRGFFIEVENGEKATLLLRPQVSLRDAKGPGAYQESEPPRFVRGSDDFYIRIGEEPAAFIARKKDLREIFPTFQKEVISYIKKHRIRPGKQDQLRDLVRYYNSL